MLLTEADCPYRQIFEQKISAFGISPYSGLEIMSLAALQSMVKSGLGIGVMPTVYIEKTLEDTVIRHIDGLSLELPVGLATLTEKTIPGLALDLLIEAITSSLRL